MYHSSFRLLILDLGDTMYLHYFVILNEYYEILKKYIIRKFRESTIEIFTKVSWL
jgi:hypothetical protein